MSTMLNLNKKKARITNIEKAAIVLLSMNKENLTKIFEQMKEDEVKELSRAMTVLEPVEGEVLDEVIEEFKAQVNQFITVVSHFESADTLLEEVLGKEKYTSLIEDIRGPQGSNTWEKLKTVNEDLLSSYLEIEHPQTIALVLSKLPPQTASKILTSFKEDLAFNVMTRILNMDSVKNETLERIEDTLRLDFISSIGKTQKRDNNEILAEIFNNFDRNNESKFMTMLEQKSPEQAEKVKSLMFTFDDMVKLTPNDIQALLKNIEKSKLPLALKGASEEVRKLFHTSLSERASKMLAEDIANLGPVRLSEVSFEQNRIVQALKEMIEKGEITVSTSNDEEFIK